MAVVTRSEESGCSNAGSCIGDFARARGHLSAWGTKEWTVNAKVSLIDRIHFKEGGIRVAANVIKAKVQN